MLYSTFIAFGYIISTKVARDPETGESKGHGFVSYDNFDSSDTAIKQMNGQYFSNKKITVEYAFKDNPQRRKIERHGTQAERVLAQNKPLLSRPGFLGLNEKIENKTLKLPPSLLAVRNSHLLSKESSANPSDMQN